MKNLPETSDGAAAAETDAAELDGVTTATGDEGQVDDADVAGADAGTDADDKPDEHEEALKAGEIDGLSESAQAKVNRRIGKAVARAKLAEEKLAEAEARIAESEQKQGDTADPETAAKIGIPPDYLSKDDVKILEKDAHLEQAEQWCLRHLRDGYEGNPESGDKAFTPEQVAERLAQVHAEQRRIGGRAALIREEKSKLAEEDRKAGMKLRLAKAKTPTVTTPPKNPSLPSGKGGAPSVTRTAGSGTKFDKKALMEAGPSRSGLVAMFDRALG